MKFIILIILCAYPALAQPFKNEAIEDNSMLIEEAYNQEQRVVQHIFNIVHSPKHDEDFLIAFTQEWPLFSQKHQLSYTIPFLSLYSESPISLGDIMLHYRYQLLGKEDYAAVSPRISIIIPSAADDYGRNSWGIEANLPVSKRVSEALALHANIGVRHYFGLRDENDNYNNKKAAQEFFAGGSIIWLIHPNFNLMLEALSSSEAELKEGSIRRKISSFIVPGFRYKVDLGKLQFVPGITAPVHFEEGEPVHVNAFFYLSFEHPF